MAWHGMYVDGPDRTAFYDRRVLAAVGRSIAAHSPSRQPSIIPTFRTASTAMAQVSSSPQGEFH
jgi:hypothetical protein